MAAGPWCRASAAIPARRANCSTPWRRRRRPPLASRPPRSRSSSGHERRGERAGRDGLSRADHGGRLRDGGKIGKRPGAPHHRERAGEEPSEAGGHTLERARQCALHRLRARPRAALCLLGPRRARSRRLGRRGTDRARYPARGAEARSSRQPAGLPGGREQARRAGGLMASVGSLHHEVRLSFLEKLRQINWTIVLLAMALCAIGLAMLYSAGNGSWEPWASRQMVRVVLGLFLMIGAAFVDIRRWMRLAYPIYFVALALLAAVDVVGADAMGAQRWLDLKVIQLQPSEVMKIALVLALARYFHGVGPDQIGRLS